MNMYDSTSTEGYTCCAHMTILILSNIHIMYMYMYMYYSTSTEGHTCCAHMTILILSNIHIHVYVHIYV